MNWQIKKLGELVHLESGTRPKGGVRNIEEGIPSLGGEHLSYDGGFNFNNIRFIPKEFYNELTKGKIKKGDILMVKDGATTGKVSFISDNFPYKEAAVNEHVFILRIKSNEILNKYLFFYLFSQEGQSKILYNFGGSTQGGINRKFAENVNIPLPPLEIQKKIVVRIEELFSKIDKAIELRQKALEETEQILPSALQKTFADAEKKYGVKK
jgi:type I restriction enzyme S subunit